MLAGTEPFSPSISPPTPAASGKKVGCAGDHQGGEKRDSDVYGFVGWRYPRLLGPLWLEGELSTRLAQSAEDTCKDEKGTTY